MLMLKATLRSRYSIMQLNGVNRLNIIIKSVPFILVSLIAGHVNVVRALIELGAKVDAEDKFKSTPLHWASDFGE